MLLPLRILYVFAEKFLTESVAVDIAGTETSDLWKRFNLFDLKYFLNN